MSALKLVILESPYAGNIQANVDYARKCMHDCFLKGEAPFASHLLYTQPGVLIDEVPAERQLGIDAGLLWGAKAEATVVYIDRGFSSGMRFGIKNALQAGRPVCFRSIEGNFYDFGPEKVSNAVEPKPDQPFCINGEWFNWRDMSVRQREAKIRAKCSMAGTNHEQDSYKFWKALADAYEIWIKSEEEPHCLDRKH